MWRGSFVDKGGQNPIFFDYFRLFSEIVLLLLSFSRVFHRPDAPQISAQICRKTYRLPDHLLDRPERLRPWKPRPARQPDGSPRLSRQRKQHNLPLLQRPRSQRRNQRRPISRRHQVHQRLQRGRLHGTLQSGPNMPRPIRARHVSRRKPPAPASTGSAHPPAPATHLSEPLHPLSSRPQVCDSEAAPQTAAPRTAQSR